MEFVIPFEIKKDFLGRDIMDLKGYIYWYDVKDGADIHFENLYYGNYDLSKLLILCRYSDFFVKNLS